MSIPRSRDLRLLAGAAGLSALGDFMAIFPLILHVQQRTGSAFAVSALIFALWGPVVLAAGVAGAIVDRFENRRILIAVSLVQAATVAAMVAGVDTLWALLPLMTVLGFGVAVSQPAEFALVPAAAGPGTDAARANGLMETVRSLGFTAGPLVGGALGAAGLLWLALALNALSFIVVAAAALLLRARRRPEPAPDTDNRVRARDGFAFLRRERDLEVTLGGVVVALALFSISATAEPFFVTRVLRGGSLAYGVLLSSWTVGMAAGSAGLAHRVGPAHLAAGALAAVFLQGLGIAGGALATVVWLALIGFSLGGVAHGVKNVLLRTLIHERAPEALRGRAFAAYNGARNGAELGALVLGGLVVGAFGARTALLIAGLGPAAIGATCLLLLVKRRHAVASVITNEGRVQRAPGRSLPMRPLGLPVHRIVPRHVPRRARRDRRSWRGLPPATGPLPADPRTGRADRAQPDRGARPHNGDPRQQHGAGGVMTQTITGYSAKSIDELPELWDGFARLVRAGLGITAFGAQIMQLPPDYTTESHDEADTGQQELYVALGGAGAVVIGDERLPLDPEHLVRVDAGTGRVLTSGPDGLCVLCIGAVPGRPYEPPAWTTGAASG